MVADMTPTPEYSAIIQPPQGLSRLEKSAFRDGVRQYFKGAKVVSAFEIDALADLIRARTRVAALQKILDTEVREMKESGVLLSVDLIPMIRQIDATTRLAIKLADRLKPSAR